MAENGTPIGNGDVEMHEGEAAETSLAAADPTDPQPPPQAEPEAVSNPEHLSTIQPAASNAATPSAQTPARPTSLPPVKSVAHGGPTRQYLNQNVTPHLLEGMKYLAEHEPEKPLQWLGDFLKERSREVEGA